MKTSLAIMLLIAGLLALLLQASAQINNTSYHLNHLEADGDARNTSVHFTTEAFRYVQKTGKWITIKHFASHAVWSYPLERRGITGLKERLHYTGTCRDFIKDRLIQGHYIKRVENLRYYRLTRPDDRPKMAIILKCSRVVGGRDVDADNSVHIEMVYCPVRKIAPDKEDICPKLSDQHMWKVSPEYTEKNKAEIKHLAKPIKVYRKFSMNKLNKIVNKSGCCSWHQGVCGCRGGSQVCCDGSLSPTCTC